jgi:hypothetical protein
MLDPSKFATDTHLLKLQQLQRKVLYTTGKCQMRTLVCELHMAFKVTHLLMEKIEEIKI